MNPNATRRPRRHVLGMVLGFVAAASCSGPAVTRTGPEQVREVSRTVPIALETLRSAIVAQVEAARRQAATLPTPLDGVTVVELEKWQQDWAEAYVDPGGYLDPYRKLPAGDRRRDLLLQDFISRSWTSEYSTAAGPVPFRCGFVLHFAAAGPAATRVSIYEVTPEVTVGKHRALAHEGIGFAKVDDIRFVEPTVGDRQRVLEWVSKVAGLGAGGQGPEAMH